MFAVQMGAIFVFWGCLGLVFYTYGLYAVLIAGLSRAFGRQARPAPLPDERFPSVSLVIAAYNEESVIEGRIRNALALDYPPGKLEIVIGSDGSSDRTAEIVRRFDGPRIRLLDCPTRRGKASVLNAALAGITSEIVLLSDANTHTDPSAARKLVRWFEDPSVGAVCGKLVLSDPRTGRNVDSLYWKYETFLKVREGRLGALLGSNGAIYAIRRDRYAPIPPDTIVDDFVIPLRAKLRTGCSIVYDPDAIAREETAPGVGSEFWRRARIGAGGFQSIGMLWPLLHPGNGWVAFTFFSHKILRWLCPFFLVGLLASNVLLAHRTFFAILLACQLAGYLLAGLGAGLPAGFGGAAAKPVRLATMFVGMNAALFVGFCRWVRGSQKAAWHRTSRELEHPPAAGSAVLDGGAA
jgi:cellulose synthase/poly-beta-1,6-N-acetylglucosamine synthase-like glycosyltransferase